MTQWRYNPVRYSNYDSWKLASPDDDWEEIEDDDPCYHEEYDTDILEGRATCAYCGESWYLSAEEIAAEEERARAYDEWQREQERPWNRFKEWLGQSWPVVQWRIFWRRRWLRDRYATIATDDDIPF